MIEYEYETGGVGGLYIPIDKVALVAPYVAMVAIAILALSASVALWRYKRNQ